MSKDNLVMIYFQYNSFINKAGSAAGKHRAIGEMLLKLQICQQKSVVLKKSPDGSGSTERDEQLMEEKQSSR